MRAAAIALILLLPGSAAPPVLAAFSAPTVQTEHSAWSGHVTRRQADIDGTTRITLFEVPSGRSAPQVYADLVAAGVTHLVNPQTAQVTALATTCQYGFAVGLGDNPYVWPCYHWANNGYSDPQVYFRDSPPRNGRSTPLSTSGIKPSVSIPTTSGTTTPTARASRRVSTV